MTTSKSRTAARTSARTAAKPAAKAAAMLAEAEPDDDDDLDLDEVDPDGGDEVEVEPIPVLTRIPAESKKPPYFVAGGTFYAQSDEGEISIRLSFKTKLILGLSGAEDEVGQLFQLLDGIGDTVTKEKLEELDFLDTLEIVMKFFQAWEEKNKARLGELSRSSR